MHEFELLCALLHQLLVEVEVRSLDERFLQAFLSHFQLNLQSHVEELLFELELFQQILS